MTASNESRPKDHRRIGVFGGTFDPPHIGHLVAAVDARQALDLDVVLMVVANVPWQKVGERAISPAPDRLAMVRAAVADRLQSPAFSNQRVTEHLQTHATVLAHETIRHTRPLTPEQADHFLRMTPMTFGLDDSTLAQIQLDHITVAMELFLCRMN